MNIPAPIATRPLPSRLAPRLYFVWSGVPKASLPLLIDHVSARSNEVMFLMSFVYRRQLEQLRAFGMPWVLDSGAFSADVSGVKIDLSEYIDFALSVEPRPFEIYALDVVGNAEMTIRNTEEMWRQGVQAIPTFHFSEPEEALLHLNRTYEKIALGGLGRMNANSKIMRRWIGSCFDRVWPKRVHGFAMWSEPVLFQYPFESVDAVSWKIKAQQYGIWWGFGALHSRRGDTYDLRSQMEQGLDLQRRLRVRWANEMQSLRRDVYT